MKKNRKTMKKSKIWLMLVISIFLVSFVFAQEVSYCCEKTVDNAFCQNAPREKCDEDYTIAPTSCEASSFCKKGCCYDSNQGTCAKNVPESSCTSAGGLWEESPNCDIPKCQYGCCLLGTEAAFVTLQTCKKMSGMYGLLTDFNGEVTDEVQCLVLATSQELGACVYEEDFTNTCKFTTQGQCNEEVIKEGLTDESSIKFHKGKLCTDERLGTDCERTRETTCKDGRVYFLDTCGNTANIYDAAKVENLDYWTNYKTPDESCDGSAQSCGNCDYIGDGTYCKEGSGAKFGDFICADVNCYDTLNGEDYKNGESWCYYDKEGNENTDSVGSRHYRHICYMGEEIIEPCADFRNEICLEDTIDIEGQESFSQAGCTVNKFQDCVIQNSSRDCLNSDKRDCVWIPIEDIKKLLTGEEIKIDAERLLAEALNVRMEDEETGRCVPRVSPGFEFWESSSENNCDIGTMNCVVKYEKGLLDSEKECVENCWCEEPSTATALAMYCSMLGDCGPGPNYVGKVTNQGYEIIIGDETDTVDEQESQESEPEAQPEFSGSPGGEFSTRDTESKPATTGNVIAGFFGDVFG